MSDDLLEAVASYLIIAERRGLVEPSRVQCGGPREFKPSLNRLTMTLPLARRVNELRSGEVPSDEELLGQVKW